jgi:hypothetical protein
MPQHAHDSESKASFATKARSFHKYPDFLQRRNIERPPKMKWWAGRAL